GIPAICRFNQQRRKKENNSCNFDICSECGAANLHYLRLLQEIEEADTEATL
ncbi:unnamed protein product, partial [Musa hybrid cultivar]